jgi:cytochrome oxidase Cu insertion factor (SCO1/SenC/PrrC family)
MRGRVAAALIAVLLAGCTSAAPEASPPTSATGPITVGAVAPDFSLPSASGGRESLSDYRGKPVLLYFSMGPG